LNSQQQMQQAASGAHSDSFLGSMSNMLGGSSNQQHGQSHSSNNSPFGMVGDLVGKVTGQGQGGHQSSSGSHGYGGGGQHHGGGNQSGGLNDMLHMAEKLPGVGSYAHKLGKFTGGSSGGGGGLGGLGSFLGGGKRGLDDEPGASRGLDEPAAGQAGHLSGGYAGSGAEAYDRLERSPSPMPLAPPPGYESYSASGLEYDGQAAAPGAQGAYGAYGQTSSGHGQQQDYYGGQQQGGYGQSGYEQGGYGGQQQHYYR
jgi:hypothetical protein